MINLVIPAAGAATRLRPLSSNTSKIMVRVNGKPCLDYIIEQATKIAEVGEIVIVDGQFSDIREYCERKHPNVKCVRQKSLDGPRDAIKIGINNLSDVSQPLVVWLGDAIILEDNMSLGEDFLLCKEVDDHSAWCMWDGNSYYNKPKERITDGVALVGLYSFADGGVACQAFNQSTDYDISDALEKYGQFERVMTNKWYDIGDLPTYYKTCATLLDMKSRAFNRLEYNHDLGTIRKSPDYHNPESIDIIETEINWYKELNENQQCFVPRIFGTNTTELTMSFESGTLLSDLMLYENLTASSWEYIIDKVFKIKLNYFNNRSKDWMFNKKFADNTLDMWSGKVHKRLEQVDLPASCKTMLSVMAFDICSKAIPISGMHGDLHFGNILYNQQTDQIKLLDPRGKYGKHLGIHGDDIYDWAKLAHDLYHGYSSLVHNVKQNEDVKNIFVAKLKEYNLNVELILNGGLVLLATCIPLHYDCPNRQQRFIDYVKANCV